MKLFSTSHAHLEAAHTTGLALLAFILAILGAHLLDGRTPGLLSSVLVAAAALGLGGVFLWLGRHVREALLLQERHSQSRALAFSRDVVSGALTRQAFIERCEAHLRQLPDHGCAMFLILDLDNLKEINDAYGHEMGDAALRRLGAVAHQMAPDAIIGRLGGDEFAILSDCESREDVARLVQLLLAELRRAVYHGPQPLNLSASIGAAMAPGDSRFFGELMQYADLALYESKRNGKAQATLFDIEMLRDKRQDRFIERELRAAVLLNDLALAYQPIFGLNGQPVSYEALVRWNHPVRGVISPSAFIPIAERSMLIDLLGEWVFRRACRDFAYRDGVSVSVNFSASQFKRDEVVAMVARVLAETGMPAERVLVEITESAAMNVSPDVRRRLETLREWGVRISLDDFGTGHCGFFYLRSFPVDVIKIDRAFVSKLGESEADDVFVSALASLARSVGVAIVAEGIETERQYVLSRAAGCHQFQGFHLGRPGALPEPRVVSLPARGLALAAG